MELLELIRRANAGDAEARAQLLALGCHRDGSSGMSIRAQSFNAETRTFNVTMTTEKAVPMPDWDRWEMIPEVLRADGMEAPEQIPLLNAHSRGSIGDILGSVRDFKREADAVTGNARIAKTADGELAAELIKSGDLTDVSVGYEVTAKTFIPEKTSQVIGGKAYDGPVNVATKSRLKELSLVPIGADSNAKIRTALNEFLVGKPCGHPTSSHKQEAGPMKLKLKDGRELTIAEIDTLRARGEDVELADGTVLRSTKATETAPAATVVDVVKERAEATKAEAERQKAIRELGAMAGATAEEIAALIDGNKSELEASREFAKKYAATRQAVPTQPVAHGGENNSVRMFAEHGHNALRIRPGRAVKDAAPEARQLARFGVLDMYRQHALASGKYRSPHEALSATPQDIHDEIKSDFRRWSSHSPSERATSTSSMFPLVLTSAIGAEIQSAFTMPDVNWDQLFIPDTFDDLREKELPQLSEPPRFKAAGEDQTVTYYSFTERGESYQLVKYLAGLSYTEELIINDRFGVFLNAVNETVMWCAAQIDESAWAAFMANAAIYSGGDTYFHANRNNLFTGAGTALDATSLGTAKKNFRLMKGMKAADEQTGKQRRIAAKPRILIVPPTLEQTALQLLNSSSLVGSSNSGVVNSVRMDMDQQPLIVPYLEDSTFTNYSTKAWYLAASREFRYALMGFYLGRQVPWLESDVDFDTSGMKFKLKHWWAPKMQKPEYVQKQKGEA